MTDAARAAAELEPVIGLEVHAQLLTRTKLFCACATSGAGGPNTRTCPVCLGLPGALPVLNAGAIDLALRAAVALECAARRASVFARKNYFYPDLAKGYQISQFDAPLAERGTLALGDDADARHARIRRVHMEEDAAKNIHSAGGETLVDFNRAGVPLIEIVGEPDLTSAAEAEGYLRRLREVLMAIGVNDGNLEEGSFRCDANVSVRPRGSGTLGTRVELKNINSFKFVRKALEHEIARQVAVVASGAAVTQETRTWDEDRGTTASMRGKEEAQDYRYFPDPDLLPLAVGDGELSRARAAVSELPARRRARWQRELGLTAYDAQVLTAHPATAAYFEAAVAALATARPEAPRGELGKRAANFIQSEVLRGARVEGLTAAFPVPAEHVAELLALVETSVLSGKMAKDVLAECERTGRAPSLIVAGRGLAQVSDARALEAAARAVLDASPKQVAQYRSGRTGVLGYFVGQVMRATAGAGDPRAVTEILTRLLGAP